MVCSTLGRWLLEPAMTKKQPALLDDQVECVKLLMKLDPKAKTTEPRENK